MSQTYLLFSDLITNAVREIYHRRLNLFINELISLHEINSHFTKDELLSLTVQPEINVIPTEDHVNLCIARTTINERCTRRPKYGQFCGAHHKIIIPDLITNPKISREVKISHKIPENHDIVTSLEKYTMVDHVEIDGRNCFMDPKTGLLFENQEPYTIIGRVDESDGTLSWLS